ncbi:MAG: 2-oxo acid dehydrogenase subunit E2 [Oscillospiraceae bacterium]|jgi:hypothetical protein
MFSKRCDGRKLTNGVDPFTRFVPLIMTKRNDAMVMSTQYIDCDKINKYINDRRKEGVQMSHMAVLIAAILRTYAEFPMLNRFVINKTLYARTDFVCTFIAVQNSDIENYMETDVKLHFDLTDTIDTVQKRMDAGIEEARKDAENSGTVKFANAILKIPLLPRIIVGILKWLDAWGVLSKDLIDISPFHSSLFITNMASLKMGYVYHHIYNFGNTSIFVGLGKREQQLKMGSDGNVTVKNVYPLGITVDERIAPGAQFAQAFQTMVKYINNPVILETPPEKVNYDVGMKPYTIDEKYKLEKKNGNSVKAD